MTSAPLPALNCPWPMTRVRALSSTMSWHWSEPGCYLRDAHMAPGHLIIPMQQGIAALSPDSGEELWRWRGSVVRRGALWHTDRAVIVQQGASHIAALDLHTGELIHTLHIPHLHRVIRLAEIVHTTPSILLLGERGTVALIDSASMQILWLHEGGTKGPAQYANDREFLLILQGNQLSKLSIATGECLWTVNTQRSAKDVYIHLNRAILLHAGAQRAQTLVRGLHLDTGEAIEEVSLDGYFLGTACSQGEDLWLVIERNRRPVVEILRGESLTFAWLKPLQEQARSISPCLTQLVQHDDTPENESLMMIQTGTSEVVAMKSTDGEVLWRDLQEPLMRAPIPALVTPGACFCLGGDALFIRRTDTGEIIHKYDRFIDEPCLMFGATQGFGVILGESPLDDGPSTLMRIDFAPTLRIAYDSNEDAS